MTHRFRTLWVSDVHLGTKASRAGDLLRFLRSVKADSIYLVGDIVDLERMRKQPLFPGLHIEVVDELLRASRSGTEVVFIPGNHDCEFRSIAGGDVMGIPVMLETTHETADGRKFLVTHGDVLDRQIRRGTNLEKFGAAAYYYLLRADVAINQFRRFLGKDYFSLSSSIKRRLRSANEYIDRFESVAANYAAARGYDGIVCGHIHRPAMRSINGCLYINDGDWVEHGTALAESPDGTLQILDWRGQRLATEPDCDEAVLPLPASA